MPLTINATGLIIQTFDEILEEIIVAVAVGQNLTAAQTQSLRDVATGSINQMVRIEAERDAAFQEALVKIYNTLAFTADGANLDRVVALLGVVRRPDTMSLISATLGGVAATVITAGSRVQYNPTGSVWTVLAEVTVGGGGTVAAVLQAESAGAVEVGAILPGDWTILDTIVGWTDVTTVEQTLIGTAQETDAELRERASIEAFRRGQGPQAAIRAAVTQVLGVTYVGVWESQAVLATGVDSDGIPARSINVVVEGGDSDDVADAIQVSRAGGIQLFGLPGGTLVTRVIELTNGSNITVNFNRVEDVDMWIEYTLTTSTSEETAPPGVIATVDAIILEQAALLHGIGDDVLPWKIEGAVHEQDIPGIDDVQVTLSFDNGGTDPFTRAKRAIAIRQLAVFAAIRISGTEV